MLSVIFNVIVKTKIYSTMLFEVLVIVACENLTIFTFALVMKGEALHVQSTMFVLLKCVTSNIAWVWECECTYVYICAILDTTRFKAAMTMNLSELRS